MEASRGGLRLWEIADELGELAEIFVENGGVLTPELEMKLDALDGDFDTKVERLALFAQQCKSNAAGTKIEEERLEAMRRAYENREKGIKRYLLVVMERAQKSKVETTKARVRLQASPSSVTFEGDPNTLPDRFKRVSVVANGAEALEASKAGEPVPFGFKITKTNHVRIY